MAEPIFEDCCDFCQRNDPHSSKEIEFCTTMTRRCKGDTCQTCKRCKDFVPVSEYVPANVIMRQRPKEDCRKLTADPSQRRLA